ncbi:MAG: hypothetical protein WCD18_13755, partial [Thermosynechococcaceae cyanobacterium]
MLKRHNHPFNFPDPGILLLSLMLPVASAMAAAPFTAPQSVQAPEPKTQQTIHVKRDGLKVQLKACLKENASTVCTLYLSSKEDLTLWVSDPNREKSRLIDFDGNEYSTFEVVQFGKPETGTVLVKKTPIKLVLSFSKLPEKLSGVALLEVGLETYGHEIPVRFRKIDFLSASTAGEQTPPAKSKSKPDIEKIPTQTPDSEPETEEETQDTDDASDGTQPPDKTKGEAPAPQPASKPNKKQTPSPAPSPAPSPPKNET